MSSHSNASNDSVPQLAILRRGKRQVATQIKTDYNNGRSAGLRQLEEILTFLLDPDKPVDFETTDWCRHLIAGGMSFQEYSEIVRQFDVTKVCGLVWTAHFIAYRCRTCGISPCMSLCPDCFNGADHTGHDFNMFRSHAGGACDCGDVNVMKPEGFCTKHGKRETAAKAVPPEVTNIAKVAISKLITRFVYYLRNKHQEWLAAVGEETFTLDDGEHLLTLLHELSGLGVVIRTILSETLNDKESYAKEFVPATDVTEEPETTTNNSTVFLSRQQYRKAKHDLPAPQPKFFRVKVCGRGGDSATRTHWRCSYECMHSAVDDNLHHKTALEEILFWTVNYEFPEKITTWLLALLPDEQFKEEFTKTFVDHYTRIATSLVRCKGNDQRQRVSNKVVHVSVQLFSNEVYAIRMTSERQLLTRMVISLYSMLSSNILQSSMIGISLNTHQVLDCSSDIIRDHCFWPLISDLVNIMSHKPVALAFMEDSLLLDIWFEMIGFLQGMNLNERELIQHVEYETDTYYASFSAEFEISCSPLWRLLLHCTDSTTNTQIVMVLRKAIEALNSWFDSVGLTRSEAKINEYQLSFHLPLHRYFAAFLCSGILHNGYFTKDELSEEFLKLLIVHPLQIQVGFYEIFAQMWVRNGLQIRGQAMTYTQCHFCNSLIDLDLYLLQVGGSYLNADYFTQTVLKAFHVEHWNMPIEATSARDNIELSQDEAMLEGVLSTLAMLLCIRTYSGDPNENILRTEIVTLLCMNDRTYSQLCESIPEKSGSTNPPADLKIFLQQVADYKAPGFNVSGKLQQGTYSPKSDVWLEQFDPLHIMLRTVHRREFQQSMDRYTEFVHNSKAFPQGQTPWPPLRIPSKPLQAYSGLYDILHSTSLLTFCFNLLHKKLNSKVCTVTETALYLVIFLIQLIVHESETDTKMVSADRDSSWFPHDTVLDNMAHPVSTVTVSVPPSKGDKEVHHSDTMMDVEEGGVEQNIQTMFSSHSSFYNSQQDLGRHVQLVRERGSNPGALSTPSPVVPVASSSSTSFSASQKKVEITLKESFISLLIKLHNKLSDKEDSYVPPSARDKPADYSTLVGDGPFFVGRVLDTLSSKSQKCAKAVENTYNDLKPKSSADSNSTGAKKKKKALDRQKKLLDKMNRMQNKFMNKIEKTMSKEEFEKLTEAEMPEDNYVVIEHYECSICSSTTPSTMDRPMGMVSLLQSTCVMNFARSDPAPSKLPLTEQKKASVDIFADFYSRAQDRLNHMFADKQDNVTALGMDRSTGVFSQSCGHYLHLDCFKAYQESVTVQSRQRQSLSGDEYHCPLCRQLANALLPILPTGSQAPVVVVPPESSMQCIQDIAAMLEQKPTKWPSEAFYNELKTVSMRLKSNAAGKIRDFLQTGSHIEVAHFLSSVARCNLDYTVLYESNEIIVPSRKSSIAHLLTALSQHLLMLDQTGSECIDILSQLTGVQLEPVNSTSLVPHQGVVPLILRDPITVFLQLYLRMPPHLSIGYFERLAAMVYNLAFVQALFHVSCKFNEDERQSWITKGTRRQTVEAGSRRLSEALNARKPSEAYNARKPSEVLSTRKHSEVLNARKPSEAYNARKPSEAYNARKQSEVLNARKPSEALYTKRSSEATRRSTQASIMDRRPSRSPTAGRLTTIEQLLQTIIKQLTTIGFYPSDDMTMSFLECSVWSPQSIECFVQNRCIAYLEFVAVLKKHVYGTPLPDRPAACTNSDFSCSQDCQQWFTLLGKYLGIMKGEDSSTSLSDLTMDWAGQDSSSIVKGWLNFVMTCKERPTIRSYVMDQRRWYMPRLLQLPEQYDTIFQFYRSMKCPQCRRQPSSPSICLVCGTFVCFKEVCCVAHSGVAHAKKCGSGTSVILDINASIVAIIRGKRATLWGSVYLDEHGEEDRDLKRGRPLYLCQDRFKMLEQQWLSHNFDYVCKRWIFHSDQL